MICLNALWVFYLSISINGVRKIRLVYKKNKKTLKDTNLKTAPHNLERYKQTILDIRCNHKIY